MSGQKAQRSTDIQSSGERVALRPWRQDDVARLGPWLGEAARAGPNGSRLAITLRGKDEPIGIIQYRAGDPEPGWLTIGFLGVAPALRARGYGSEAVRLLEEQAVRRGLASGFRASLAPDNGLGLYFWLRLGYRPLAAEGIIAMVRRAHNPSLQAGA